MITTPTDTNFETWLQTITFTGVQPSDPCSAPPPMQVTGVDVTLGVLQLSASWDEVADADGYKVQWKSGMEEFDSAQEDTVTGGSTTSHTITGLTAGRRYTVRVIATKSNADDGQPSLEDTGTPQPPPPPPPPGQITRISVTPGVLQLSASWDEVADADGYKVQWKSGMEEFDSAQEDTVTGGSTTSHTITGLTAGRRYTVRVIATKSNADDGRRHWRIRARRTAATATATGTDNKD